MNVCVGLKITINKILFNFISYWYHYCKIYAILNCCTPANYVMYTVINYCTLTNYVMYIVINYCIHSRIMLCYQKVSRLSNFKTGTFDQAVNPENWSQPYILLNHLFFAANINNTLELYIIYLLENAFQ